MLPLRPFLPNYLIMITNGSTINWEKTEAGKRIQARLSDEGTLNTIDHLLSRIDLLEKSLASLSIMLERLPGLAAISIDTADDLVQQANEHGVDINERLGTALQLAERLTQPAMVEKLDAVLKLSDQMPGLMAMGIDTFDEVMRNANDSGFDPQALAEMATNANAALMAARAEPPAKVGGIFGMLRVLNDPDRQRGIGFLMNFLKHFGKNI